MRNSTSELLAGRIDLVASSGCPLDSDSQRRWGKGHTIQIPSSSG